MVTTGQLVLIILKVMVVDVLNVLDVLPKLKKKYMNLSDIIFQMQKVEIEI